MQVELSQVYALFLGASLAGCTKDECRCSDDTGDDTHEDSALHVAIYDDGDGRFPSAWAAGLDAIEEAMLAAGIESERLSRARLNEEATALEGFDALLFGGGFAWPGYTRFINPQGKERIRELVQGGGAFVGICAGAYFACDVVDYEGTSRDDESGYDLDLYPGICGGPVDELSHYPDWSLATVGFPGHESHEEVKAGSFQRQIFYAGGPFFEDPPDGVEVLARYENEGPHQGFPAVVAVPHGEGRVVLWGPHPEVERVAGMPEVESDEINRQIYASMVRWAAGH